MTKKTKQIEIDEIEKVFIRQAKKILKLSFSDGSFVEVTPDHPYFTTNRGWVDAGKLNIDDKLLAMRQDECRETGCKASFSELHFDSKLENVSLVSSEEEAGDQVFNLLVKKNHNYFAGGILVHNKDYPQEALDLATDFNYKLFDMQNTPVLKGSVEANFDPAFDNTITDLIDITNRNVNLNGFQKIDAASKFNDIQTKYRNNTITQSEAKDLATQVGNQVKLIQGEKAASKPNPAAETKEALKDATSFAQGFNNALISGLVEGELTVLAAAEDALAARGNLDCIQFPAICSAQTGFLDQIVQHIDEEGIVPMPKDADIHWYYAGKVAGDTGVFMIGIVQGTAGMLTILAGIGVGVGGGGAGVLGAPETGGASLTLSYVSLETAAVAIPAGATIATAGISTGAVGSGNFQSDLSDWKNSLINKMVIILVGVVVLETIKDLRAVTVKQFPIQKSIKI